MKLRATYTQEICAHIIDVCVCDFGLQFVRLCDTEMEAKLMNNKFIGFNAISGGKCLHVVSKRYSTN
jgi:hypothetical protein